MRRPLAALALAALLTLAGCTGSLPGGSPTLDDVTYPPGVADDGTNATALADAHETALANRSFTLRLTRTGASGDDAESYTTRTAVSADRDRLLAHLNGSGGSTSTLYFTAETVYERSHPDGTVRYEVRDRASRSVQTVPASPTGSSFIHEFLAVGNFTPDGVVVENGTTLVVLTADDASLLPNSLVNVTQFDARVLVDEQGLVHRATMNYTATDGDGETITASTTLRITRVGETDVPEPDWLDEAQAESD